jgi:deazaflavin-dependent oxidoreductase (nitroreductase family)
MAMSPRLIPRVQRFNRFARRFAVRVPPFVVLHNVGRKSGTEYHTPVVAFAGYDEGTRMVATPLAWGRDAAWSLNIQAAGSYRLTRRGKDYLVDEVRIVERDDAVRLVGGGARLTNTLIHPDGWVVGRLRGTPA